jgi:hypothetical protein
MEAIKKMFTPEFRNRLDAIVQFAPLTIGVIKTVVDKFLMELQTQLDDKHVTLEISEDAREWLAVHGYDEKMGGSSDGPFDSGKTQEAARGRDIVRFFIQRWGCSRGRA